MNATYAELHEIYRELYDAIPPAHTVEAVMPYWRHVSSQLMGLQEFAAQREAGDLEAAHRALAGVVEAHNAGVGGDAQWALMQAHAAGELDHAPAAFSLIEGNLFGTHQLPVPSADFGAVEMAAPDDGLDI